MNLSDIIDELLIIEEKLYYNEISFSYDNLMSAMKIGHPVEIFDGVISNVYWAMRDGKEPDIESVKNLLTNLKAYQDDFEVKELSEPIEHLEQLLGE